MRSNEEYFYTRGVGWTLRPPYKILEFDKGDGWWLICENRARMPDESSWAEGDFDLTARSLGHTSWSVSMLDRYITRKRSYGPVFAIGGPSECVFRLERR